MFHQMSIIIDFTNFSVKRGISGASLSIVSMLDKYLTISVEGESHIFWLKIAFLLLYY